MSYFTNPTIFNIIRWVTGSLGPTIKIKSLECPESIRNYEKNNTWNIRHLVDESFVPEHNPVTQHIILKIVGFVK